VFLILRRSCGDWPYPASWSVQQTLSELPVTGSSGQYLNHRKYSDASVRLDVLVNTARKQEIWRLPQVWLVLQKERSRRGSRRRELSRTFGDDYATIRTAAWVMTRNHNYLQLTSFAVSRETENSGFRVVTKNLLHTNLVKKQTNVAMNWRMNGRYFSSNNNNTSTLRWTAVAERTRLTS